MVVSRSGVLVLAYLVMCQGQSLAEGHRRCASEPRHRTQLWISGAAEAVGAEPQPTEHQITEEEHADTS
ncbi:hypothetical protein VZT92_001666 [Zoarces viviparus]|uniref:Secreted protein n=1 Tax=Zoarces viviparus TaxID=48416 RepID=A0AAW1G5J5_ZOAVI